MNIIKFSHISEKFDMIHFRIYRNGYINFRKGIIDTFLRKSKPKISVFVAQKYEYGSNCPDDTFRDISDEYCIGFEYESNKRYSRRRF